MPQPDCSPSAERNKQPLLEVLDAMRRRVAEFTATEVLEDDFTMLALRRKASPDP